MNAPEVIAGETSSVMMALSYFVVNSYLKQRSSMHKCLNYEALAYSVEVSDSKRAAFSFSMHRATAHKPFRQQHNTSRLL
jgi:hypothetical protein